jgi:phosphatidylserine decarboxylase
MVGDGYYYGFVLLGAAVLIGWLTTPAWTAIPVVLACFFMWFFRDPERAIPSDPGLVVAPADGKVTAVAPASLNGKEYARISIFLNVFNVHVNRSPMGGVIRSAKYQEGKFLNAMNEACADLNEQNTVIVEGEGHTLVFKQIAGLLARRVVFTKKVGDTVARGERIGMMKFSSRMDVFLERSASIQVKAGDHVKGGSSVLALLTVESKQSGKATDSRMSQGAR